MKYILNKDYRLRGWTDHLSCVEHYPTRELRDISSREYGLLSRCDGKTDVDTVRYGEAIGKFTKLGVISQTEGAQLDPVQAFRFYENRLFRNADICVTGCCDFRCRHCFNASDNEYSRGTQPTAEKLIELIAKLESCGICNITLSGGEPLLHKDFLGITEELRKRDMHFQRLVTNLYHMTPEIADTLISQGHRPLISTSFDGLGAHEWLRQKEGSEKRTLDMISMMKQKGFRVRAHCCAWKDSLPVIRDSVLRLKELGVDEFRIVNIEPSLRWRQNAGDQAVSITEWLEFICGLIDWWYENKIDMSLDVWWFWQWTAGSKYVNIVPDGHCHYDIENKIPICADGYNTPYIDSDGRLLLCNATSGYSKAMGWEWGNAFTDDLQSLLREGQFIKFCSRTVRQMKELHPKCMSCEWVKHCQFGCRAEAVAYGGDFSSPDIRMCAFFKDGYYKRFKKIADKYGLMYDGK